MSAVCRAAQAVTEVVFARETDAQRDLAAR